MAKPYRDVTVNWVGGLKFESVNRAGVTIRTDSEGREGFSAMEMLLVALAACTGADVVSILEKKRQAVTGVAIQVHGERSEEHPRKYTDIQVKFIITGHGLEPEAVRRAIELSSDKYCSVSATLAGAAQVSTSFELRQAEPAAAPGR